MTVIFDTHGSDSELNERSGQKVEVIRKLTDDECDVTEVGNMYRIRFKDGFETSAFEDELVEKKEIYEMQDIREVSMIVGHHFNSICEKYLGLDDWSASKECATVASLVCHMVKVLNISPEKATNSVVKFIAEHGFREVEDHAWDEYTRGFIAGQILGIPTKENLKLLEEAEELWDYDGNNECKYGYFQEVCEEVKE